MTEAPRPVTDAPYFAVSRQKFIVMSMTTLSLYQIFWFYMNWKMMDARKGSGGSPFWRALAAPITAHGLFADVRTDAQSRFVTVGWTSSGLAVIYLGLALCALLEYPWWTIALGSVFALVPVHTTMEEVNRKVAPAAPRNDTYSSLNAVGIVLGLVLTVLGLYLTREAQIFVDDLLNQL